MSIITVGIDLAKNVFAVHGVDDNGKAALVKPKVSREHLLPLFALLPPCVIGMEASPARTTGRGNSACTATPLS
jgi:transposase